MSQPSATLNSDDVLQTSNKTKTKDDSLSDMFKKMTLKERNSRKLSDLNNFDVYNEPDCKNDFMTSSPIRSDSKLIIPKFKRKETSLEINNTNRNSNMIFDDKENKEYFIINVNNDNKDRSEIIKKESIEETMSRNQTVRCFNKPPTGLFVQNVADFDVAGKKTPKSELVSLRVNNIRRSISLHPSKNNRLVAQNNSNNGPKVTKPKPFSFERKDKEMLENRQKLVEDDLNERKRMASAFRANPMPISYPKLPEKSLNKPTNPIGFEFESDKRIHHYLEKSVMKSENQSSSNLSVSINANDRNRSKDLTYLSRSPFQPKPSTQPITIPETPAFVSKIRIEQRKEYDEQVREMKQKAEKIKEEMEKEKQEQERLELIKLRKQNITRARPIRHYKKIEIVHNRKVTVPETPKFSSRFKK